MSVGIKKEFKRIYNLFDLYRILISTPAAILKLIENKKKNLISILLIKRLQLVITGISGCSICSFQQTKVALRLGMSSEEITSFLSGGDDFLSEDEAKAILFAHQFGVSKGRPAKQAYESIVEEYGEGRASIILSSLQLALVGNIYGLSYRRLISRLKGESYKDSSIFYEFGMLLGGLLIFPIAFVQGLIFEDWASHAKK